MSTHTISNTDTTLVTEECYRCGVLFAMPKSLRDSALKHTQAAPGQTISFFCPNGHSQSYLGKNREQELEERLERERARSGRLASERDQIEAQRRAQKAATTRAKTRHAAGVCPACKRSFQNVKRHMDSQHPDFDPAS